MAQQLGKMIFANVKSVTATGLISKFVDGFRENRSGLQEYGIHMVRRLVDSGLSPYEIAWSQILPTATAMVPNQAQVVSFADASL